MITSAVQKSAWRIFREWYVIETGSMLEIEHNCPLTSNT
jgi:hypothetical protein